MADVALGDRSNMAFQNTSVHPWHRHRRRHGDGHADPDGSDRPMLTSVIRTRSPLQKELDSLTKVLAIIAWSAVAFIFVVGLARGVPASSCSCSGRRWPSPPSRPACPRSSRGSCRMGAKQLAEAKAIVKNLTDVETLGCDERHQHRQDRHADHEPDDGVGPLRRRLLVHRRGRGLRARRVRSAPVAGAPVPDFTRLALGLCLDSDATVDSEGHVVGDPTEAALVVLAAKLGVDAEETRRAYPRLAEVPFDSEYKFMATFHEATIDGVTQLVELVKGAPDVVLGPMQPVRRPPDRLAGHDRRGEGAHRRGQRAHGPAGAARARLRRARPRRRRPAPPWHPIPWR